MLRLNFAPRLMVAMMLIVTLVAGSIFAVTRGKLETAWSDIIETRFLSQTESLATMQKARLSSIQERCRELAASGTVIRALESGSGELPEGIYRELLAKAWVVQASANSFDEPGRQTMRNDSGQGRIQSPDPALAKWDGFFRDQFRNDFFKSQFQSGLFQAPLTDALPRAPGAGPAAGMAASASAKPSLPSQRPSPGSSFLSLSPDGQRPEIRISGNTGSRPGSGGGSDFRRRRFGRPDFGRPEFLNLALMDVNGQIRTVRSGGGPDHEKDWLVRNKVSRVPAAQEVAYMVIKPDSRLQPPSGASDRAPEPRPPMFGMPLREVIITPIKMPGNDEPMGALIVGLPVSNYGESALYDLKRRDNQSGDLFTGQWIDDQLFSWTIPEAAREPVSRMVRENLAGTGTRQAGGGDRDEDGNRIHIDGRPYQILLRSLNTSPFTPPAYQITLFSLAGLEAQKKEVRLQVIGYSALAFAAAMLLSWLFARRLVDPVQALVEGTRKIKNGQYDTRVEVTTRDELADLASSFNEMAEGLRQRERYRDILFQVSDDDIARKLIETACLGGERREISVLFCDIRSFTATTNGMAPEGIIDMLNEHMTALTAIVHKHHGVVDKFVGDLIMAIFGAPKSYGDDAGNAAACALEMVARREELNETTAHPPLLMGIGIASGTAVAGCMGSEHRLNYTVLGEPVNLASRLCSAAGPREVILDPHTVSLLGGRAVGHQLKPLLLKGFPEPVPLFHLTRLDTAEFQETDTAQPHHSPGVGTAA